HLPVVTGVTLTEAREALRDAGLMVLAADGTGEHDLDRLQDLAVGRDGPALGPSADDPGGARPPDLSRPTAWVFGNEAWGLGDDDRELADAVVRVPVHGLAESLNLAAAATLCLFASARAQRRDGR